MDQPHGQHECLETIQTAHTPTDIPFWPANAIMALKLASGCPEWREKADKQLAAIKLEPAFHKWCFDHRPPFAVAGLTYG
ncbi:hypothetical protein GCM10011614_13680 [Novosphingobium colocasiae]|uniref:Uncharacterized protein n=1 Tax=Novosphingobium colocasiae TaxID=1256513 RepID=A0A918PCV8_9SPHN|nr:hypothetical protein GCM10011614_13680 [Novosphingobium colocasiae]